MRGGHVFNLSCAVLEGIKMCNLFVEKRIMGAEKVH